MPIFFNQSLLCSENTICKLRKVLVFNGLCVHFFYVALRICIYPIRTLRFKLLLLCNHINRYDLVDLTRQVLAKYANDVFIKIIKSYKSNSMNHMITLCQHFLGLVNDLDTLLASHEGFLLGPWLENAKGLARDRKQEIQVIIFLHSLINT